MNAAVLGGVVEQWVWRCQKIATQYQLRQPIDLRAEAEFPHDEEPDRGVHEHQAGRLRERGEPDEDEPHREDAIGALRDEDRRGQLSL